MQPYFVPYFGYWQLMAAADRFVVYDDVQYIKGGWISRNRIKVKGAAAYISLRLAGASPNRRICDIQLVSGDEWKTRLVRTVEQAYVRAPFFRETIDLARSVILCRKVDLADYLLHGLMLVREHLRIMTPIVETSRQYRNEALRGSARVVDICKREGATHYLNAEGGRELYSVDDFRPAGLGLSFLTMRPIPYAQGAGGFISHLSVLDVLMWLGRDGAASRLGDCNIEAALA